MIEQDVPASLAADSGAPSSASDVNSTSNDEEVLSRSSSSAHSEES